MNADVKVWDGAIELYSLAFEEARLGSEESSTFQIDEIISEDKFFSALEEAMKHHIKHVSDTELNQSTVDIYKALSWITWFMSKSCTNNIVRCWAISAGLDALNLTLSNERAGIKLPYQTLNLLSAFIKNEIAGIYEHGIALNGLFLSFHSANEALKLK